MVEEDGGDWEHCGRITSRNGQKYHIMTASEWHKIENDGDPWQPTCWLHNDEWWWKNMPQIPDMVKAWAAHCRYMWAGGEILVKSYKIPSRIRRVTFNTESSIRINERYLLYCRSFNIVQWLGILTDGQQCISQKYSPVLAPIAVTQICTRYCSSILIIVPYDVTCHCVWVTLSYKTQTPYDI